jgi:hypothetical protein
MLTMATHTVGMTTWSTRTKGTATLMTNIRILRFILIRNIPSMNIMILDTRDIVTFMNIMIMDTKDIVTFMNPSTQARQAHPTPYPQLLRSPFMLTPMHTATVTLMEMRICMVYSSTY